MNSYESSRLALANHGPSKVVIIYMDTGCLGRWVSFWKTCRSNSQLFERPLICTAENEQDCVIVGLTLGRPGPKQIDIMVQHPSEVCEPHVSWTLTSMSRCIQITLLRLQEVFGRQIVGLWIGGVWVDHFSRVRKTFPGSKCAGKSLKFHRKSDPDLISGSEFCNFRA